MGLSQRNKGKVGERELARELARLFGVDCRRGQQFCGSAGDADVVGLPGVHVECKRVEALNLGAAVAQAVGDAADGVVPVVMHRKSRSPWLVTVRLDDMPELASRLYLVLSQKGTQ